MLTNLKAAKKRKGAQCVWNEECQKALDNIHEYFRNPPVLVPPKPDRPFLLYISATDTALAAVLAQHDDSGKKESAIYYISKSLVDYEQRYSPIEKQCLAVVWATSKLRHYLLTQPIKLLAKMDPLKYIFEKAVVCARTARWQMLLLEFDISYVTQKSVKAQAIAEPNPYLPFSPPSD